LLYLLHALAPLQVLGRYTSRARQLPGSSTQSPPNSALQQELQLGLQALVIGAAAASTLAKHSNSSTAAGVAAAQQHYATAVQDFSTAAELLQSLDAAAAAGADGSGAAGLRDSSGDNWHSSSNVSSKAKVLLDFGLLCSHLHQHHQQQQQEQQQQTLDVASWPAAAAGAVGSAGGLAALAVQNLLAAMAAGGASSNEASIHIPTVLAVLPEQQLGTPNSSAAACAAFAAGWGAVPLHVFLPWTSQLLARLGDVEGEVLQQPLEALASRCVLTGCKHSLQCSFQCNKAGHNLLLIVAQLQICCATAGFSQVASCSAVSDQEVECASNGT
jgi:hypothetical protein